MKAPLAHNEQERLQALDRCQLLDTPPEESYDRITRVAAQLFSTPISSVTLVAKDRQFLKSTVGLEVRETERDIAFCAHAILEEEPLVVLDARLDPRFSDNPLVTGEPGIRFYCGAPIKTPDGFRVGTLCVVDTKPRTAVPEQLISLLRGLAAQASTEIEHRHEGFRLAHTFAALLERERELEQERQLRHNSEIRAELALEAGNMGSWEWEAASRQVTLSPVMQRLFGYIGRDTTPRYFKWLERIHPEDRKPIAELIRSADKRCGIFTLEFRVIPFRGSVRWLALKGRYRRDGDDRLAGANGVCWDITERRKAEEELRASEEVFRGISSSSPVGIFQADLNGRVCYVNPRNLEIWSLTEEEILGSGWISRVHPEDARSVVDGWIQANAEGRSYDKEYRLLLPDGTVRWVYARSSILHDRTGVPIGTVGTLDDITERKRLEEERHASQELTRRILDSSADCIKVLDLEGHLLSMSPGGQRALGIADIQPLIGREYFSLWKNGRDREAAKTAFRAAIKGGVGSFQGFFPRVNGELRWWDTVFSPIVDRTGRPERILAVSRDMTELRRASAEQEKARELAEEANRAKSLFVANVSHELRTPLNGVLGMTELLLASQLTPEQQELATTVKQSGTALLALVNDLLDLGRVEAGKLDCKRASFDLRSMVSQAVALMAPAAKEKRLELTVDYPDSVPKLLVGDGDRIRQIVINYLHNALKFTDQGRISVEVRAEQSADAIDVLIAVRDTGKGIPKEAQAHLFTPFRQVDASSTRKHGGIGLGLALSKRIAEVMGGSVGLMSKLGEGSTFWARLPLTLAEKRGAADQFSEQDDAKDTTPEAPRVLVAEDNTINQKVVLQFLKKLGCVPDMASDGAVAVRLFEQNTYDLVLMDCQMPELDGYQATERIR